MRNLDASLAAAAFSTVALWLTVHDPKRADLHSLNRHERARRRVRR